MGICDTIRTFADSEANEMIKDMSVFNSKIGGIVSPSYYWFITKVGSHKSDRIEFLQKYIEHLKQNDENTRKTEG